MRGTIVAAGVAVMTVLAWPCESFAFERQWRVGGGLGVASLVDFEGMYDGGALGLHGGYGLSDMFDVVLEVDASAHVLVADTRTNVYSASAGISYKVDVIEWIPYAALLVGYYRFDGPRPFESPDQIGAGIAIGIDYAFSRSVAVGLQLRYHGFADDLPGSVLGVGSGPYVTTLLRGEYRWGY